MPDATLPIATAIIGALIGSGITEISGRHRHKKQELRDRATKIEEKIRALEVGAIEYWMVAKAETDARVLEYKIKNEKKTIALEVSELRKKGFSVSRDVDVELFNLNRAVTSAPFESRPHQSDPSKIPNVEDAANNLIAELRRSLKIV